MVGEDRGLGGNKQSDLKVQVRKKPTDTEQNTGKGSSTHFAIACTSLQHMFLSLSPRLIRLPCIWFVVDCY